MSQCRSLSLSYLRILLKYVFNSFFKHRKFGSLIFKNIFFLPYLTSPSGTFIIHMLVHLMVSHRSLRICLFILIILKWRITINLSLSSLIQSSACSNLLLDPLVNSEWQKRNYSQVLLKSWGIHSYISLLTHSRPRILGPCSDSLTSSCSTPGKQSEKIRGYHSHPVTSKSVQEIFPWGRGHPWEHRAPQLSAEEVFIWNRIGANSYLRII